MLPHRGRSNRTHQPIERVEKEEAFFSASPATGSVRAMSAHAVSFRLGDATMAARNAPSCRQLWLMQCA